MSETAADVLKALHLHDQKIAVLWRKLTIYDDKNNQIRVIASKRSRVDPDIFLR